MNNEKFQMIEQEEKVAVISDVHSNSIALAAVLDDIRKKGISRTINLGDSLYGPIDPNGTFQLINNSNIISISGNQDRLIRDSFDQETANPTLEFVKKQLSKEAKTWLKDLPFELNVNNDIYCCHGTPQNDEEYLFEQVEEQQVSIRDVDEIARKLAHLEQKVILCGHSHIPKSMWVNDKLLVNAGSVGLQAYDDDLPYYHKMENYSPHARYMVVRNREGLYSADIVAVEYNFEEAARLAEINGRKDWGYFLKTGIANFEMK